MKETFTPKVFSSAHEHMSKAYRIIATQLWHGELSTSDQMKQRMIWRRRSEYMKGDEIKSAKRTIKAHGADLRVTVMVWRRPKKAEPVT